MNMENLGTYLDRQVELSYISELTEIDRMNYACSLTLVWLCKPNWKVEDLRVAIKTLAWRRVLGITIAGEKTDESFSILLDTLGPLPGPHIMTGVSREDDEFAVVQAFLLSALPSEERFDDWQGYNIIVVGDESAFKRMSEAVKRFLRRSL